MDSAEAITWPDEVDEILTGDLVVAVGSPTERGGVALYSVTPLGQRDREAGTVTFTTSLGFGRKLERIAQDPRIAVAYHTRRHGHSDRPGLVVVQGVAAVHDVYTEEELRRLADRAGEHLGQVVTGRFWDWWLSVYYRDRVGVEVTARRVLWWPTGTVDEDPITFGEPLPTKPPPSQSPPRDPRTPRVPMRRVRRAAGKEHRLLGILQADGMPLVLPVEVNAVDEQGLALALRSDLVPAGGRRAGFLGHSYRARLLGLSTATATGWLESDEELRWTPHTLHAFTAPPNKTLLLLGNGAAARWGYRQARKKGRDEIVRRAASSS
jgi:hypothetical protein